jgi:hypothetical protein
VAESGVIVGDDQLVILEPETWIGREFPLFKHIDIDHQLAEGDWIVLVYHHECPKCREVLRDVERLAVEMAARGNRARVALIEVPPFAPNEVWGHRRMSLFNYGRFSNSREWFVETPLWLRLEEGTVVGVSRSGDLRVGGTASPQYNGT